MTQPSPIPVNATVIIVGNAPTVFNKQLGSVIDMFDEVVRFNEFRCKGYDKHTGSKTTIWVTFGRGMLPGDDSRPKKILMAHETAKPAYEPDELYKIPLSFYHELRKEIQANSKLANADVLLPSSGFLVIRYLLEKGFTNKIVLAGFNHFSKKEDGRHHYWNNQKFKRPKEHDGDYEQEFLNGWVNEGKVVYLG
jgi:hypothetical protein